jgi:hypothetical protein
MSDVIVVIGQGQIIADVIARRIHVGQPDVLADVHLEYANAMAAVLMDGGVTATYCYGDLKSV